MNSYLYCLDFPSLFGQVQILVGLISVLLDKSAHVCWSNPFLRRFLLLIFWLWLNLSTEMDVWHFTGAGWSPYVFPVRQVASRQFGTWHQPSSDYRRWWSRSLGRGKTVISRRKNIFVTMLLCYYVIVWGFEGYHMVCFFCLFLPFFLTILAKNWICWKTAGQRSKQIQKHMGT